MFIYMHYNTPEPEWAKSLRELVPAYSPGWTWEAQEEALAAELADKTPVDLAGAFREVFQLDAGLWNPLSDARSILAAAEHHLLTDHLVWRDQWLLLRSDAVVTDVTASLEIPLFAAMLRIPVVGVSFTSQGTNPWMAKSAQLTLNNPIDGEQILSSMGVQLVPEEAPEEAPESGEEAPESDEEVPDLPVGREVIS
jgi:hypothetical protein